MADEMKNWLEAVKQVKVPEDTQKTRRDIWLQVLDYSRHNLGAGVMDSLAVESHTLLGMNIIEINALKDFIKLQEKNLTRNKNYGTIKMPLKSQTYYL